MNYNFNEIYQDFFGETKNQSIEATETKEENLNLDEKSKTLLNKIIQYMELFYEKKEKNKIPFCISLETETLETIEEVTSLLKKANQKYHYTSGIEVSNLSFYNFSKIEELETIYQNSSGIVVIKDLEAFRTLENDLKKKFIHVLKEKLLSNTITIVAGKKELLKEFLEFDLELMHYFMFSLVEDTFTLDEIYFLVMEQLEDQLLTEEFKISLLDYISATYQKSDLDALTYVKQLIHYISFHKSIPVLEQVKNTEEIFKELNELVGLQKVKKVFYELVDFITLKNKTDKDLKFNNVNLHMVFLGNPGTGKTTVARMICHILYDLKYIKQNKLIEVSAKDLVGEYVGQTGPKTMSVIEKSLGGVLFIDEAYALNGDESSYNKEAIATLIKAMEDYRSEFVVILAGYTKEMQGFLNSNSGIVSRIGYTLEFEDYTNEELSEIFKSMIKKSGFILEDGVLDVLDTLIEEHRSDKNFGNARFIRNVYEKTILRHATNTKNVKNKKVLKTITKEDISVS